MADNRRGTPIVQTPTGPKSLRISPKVAQAVSPVRRDVLQEEIEHGMVKEAAHFGGSSLKQGMVEPSSDDGSGVRRGTWLAGNRAAGGSRISGGAPMALIAHSPSFVKNAASVSVAGGALGTSAGTNVERMAPEVYSPLWTMANLNLPRDRITVNAWCFIPETMVWMADGTRKPIKEIRVGDMVLSGEGLPRCVITTFKRQVNEEIVGIRVKGSQETVWCTKNHRFKAIKADKVGSYIFEKREAGLLGAQDALYMSKDKTIQLISDINYRQYVGLVYNIEVGIDHTYVVGCGIFTYNCRNFFDLHPLVRNAITLHATYPISKINIKCFDRKIQQEFEDMIEEMDLLEALGNISLELWKLGETFPYAELDENNLKWKRVVIQNSDYINVKKMVLASEPVISLRPDAVLQRLVMSSNPADVQLRKQIPENIIHHIRRGENIPLDNFNVSHLKMLSSPYDIRGTSIIISVFKDLMLYDKLRECFSIDTEILTENGFKFYDQIDSNDKLATLDKTGKVEFQNYSARIKRPHDGDMYHFSGKKLDVFVTPGHRMWLAQKQSHGNKYHDFDFIEAKDIKKGYSYKLQCVADWSGKEIETVSVNGYEIPAETYMKILGHLVSEGCITYKPETYQYKVGTNQKVESSHFESVHSSMSELAKYCDKHLGTCRKMNTQGFSINNPSEIENWHISSKWLAAHFANEIGTNSHNKHLPQWVKGLSSRLLKILLTAAAEGDGTIEPSKYGTSSVKIRYTTVSEQLADDIQEIAFKCGYAPIKRHEQNGQGKWYWAVDWSNTQYGRFPSIYGNLKKKNNGGGGTFKTVPYHGDVFCFEVPNGLLITRRNGFISIQGNCKFAQADGLVNPITLVKVGGAGEGEFHPDAEQLEYWRQIIEEAQYDKDFKIITHAAVDIQRVGANGAVIDISSDIELILKNIMHGLMVPQAIIDTDSAVYSSASIGLEVLRQRYFNFRNMLAKWLINKIFAPISELRGYYKAEGGCKKLIVPEIEWNHMNLYDMQEYIQNISSLVTSRQVSVQTLYRSLGLNYEDERAKMRQEAINEAIRQREEQALAGMSLSELRSLDPEREIMESAQMYAPPPAGAQPMGGELGMPPMPPMGGGGGLGGLGPMPPAGGGGGMPPMGLPELAPPPGEALTKPPSAGTPPIGGGIPALGPK